MDGGCANCKKGVILHVLIIALLLVVIYFLVKSSEKMDNGWDSYPSGLYTSGADMRFYDQRFSSTDQGVGANLLNQEISDPRKRSEASIPVVMFRKDKVPNQFINNQ